MKKTLFLLAALSVIALVLGAIAEEQTQIKVKSSAVVSGVVLVDITKEGKPYQLQCNEGILSCKTLKAGTYWMVELPPNFGLYDCKNVEIYRIENGSPSPSGRIGEYCLNQP